MSTLGLLESSASLAQLNFVYEENNIFLISDNTPLAASLSLHCKVKTINYFTSVHYNTILAAV